jgi:hypothetical protein
MAESDTAGPAPRGGPPAASGPRSFTLADIQRDLDRATAPFREAQKQAERSMAPVFAVVQKLERDRQRIAAVVDNGIGRYLREIVGASTTGTASKAPAPIADHPPAPSPPLIGPAAPIVPRPTGAGLDASPAAMSALVERVAEAVVKRLAASPQPAKARRGRRRREISVGGVDAALEALAEEDPSVRALAARALAERVPYSRRTIENCNTYKAWRRDLKALRLEAAADDMADVLDAGLARIRKKKPGRGRLVDPTIDPAVEKITREFLRFHGEEGLDGQ